MDGRGSSGSDGEPNEEEGVEGETSWEWEVAESTLARMYDEQGICWDPEDAVAYILSRVWRLGRPEHMRTYNCLSMAGKSAWHTDRWIRVGMSCAREQEQRWKQQKGCWPTQCLRRTVIVGGGTEAKERSVASG